MTMPLGQCCWVVFESNATCPPPGWEGRFVHAQQTMRSRYCRTRLLACCKCSSALTAYAGPHTRAATCACNTWPFQMNMWFGTCGSSDCTALQAADVVCFSRYNTILHPLSNACWFWSLVQNLAQQLKPTCDTAQLPTCWTFED